MAKAFRQCTFSQGIVALWVAFLASEAPVAHGGITTALFPPPCAEVVAARRSETKRLELSADEKALFDAMLVQLGGRAFVGPATGGPRWQRRPNGSLESRATSGDVVRVRFVGKISEPTLETPAPRERLLLLPNGFRLNSLDDRGRGLLRRTFLGHPLYPFLVDPAGPHRAERLALNEPALVQREIQRDVIAVGEALLDAFERDGSEEDQRLLAASPTGTGKSEMVRALLHYRLEQSGPGLYVVMSDYTTIVEQLAREVQWVSEGGFNVVPIPLRIVRWDGGRRVNSRASSLEALAKLVQQSEVPVILVSTASAFRQQVGAVRAAGEGDETEFELDAAKLRTLRKMLRYWVYDEAHHTGAMQIGRIFEASLRRNKKAAALLVTATPDVRVQRLAGSRGFYTYLDTPDEWLVNRKSAGRSPGEAILQLRAAFDRGDLASFEELRPLIFADKPGAPVFNTFGRGKARELREEHYGSLFAQVGPAMRRKPTLVSANSQREALRITEHFSRLLGPSYTVGVLTSDFEGTVTRENGKLRITPFDGDAKEMFRNGEIDVLVAVDRLNEGVDLPPAAVLVDLRADPDPSELLQRFGRLTRTAPGKGWGELEVFLAQERTREQLIAELDALERNASPGKWKPSKRAASAPIVFPIAVALPRILDAGRFDFWNAPPAVTPIVTPENFESFLPLLQGLKKTFVASPDFSRVLQGLRGNLPKAQHMAWLEGLHELAPEGFPKALLANAVSGASPGQADRVVRVVELYARLKGIPIPAKHFTERDDVKSLLTPFGFASPVVTIENAANFVPLLEALKTTFVAGRTFSNLLSAFERDLPKQRRLEWRK